MRRSFTFHFVICVLFALSLPLSGCLLGPGSLRHSRTNYNRAVQKTAREELLLNLVRMRYDQSVEFMRIPSITGQYSYDLDLAGTWSDGNPNIPSFLGMGMQSKPTIVYAPEQEQEFNRRLLSPIRSETIELLASKGWRIDRVLMLTVHNINDVENAISAGGPTPKYQPIYEEFKYFTEMMRALQVDDHSFEFAYKKVVTDEAVQVGDPIPIEQIDGESQILAVEKGYRFHVSADNKSATLWKNEIKSPDKILRFAKYADESFEVQEICSTLELDPELKEFQVSRDSDGQLARPHSRRSPNVDVALRNELIVSTRSLKEIMHFLSQPVEVPDSHIKKGIVRQTIQPATNCPFDWQEIFHDLFRVQTSKIRPRGSAVSIKHNEHWFYIDESDIESKRTFNLLLELFNLEIRAGGGAQIPLLTI
ncbi:MAG: hypothetical protein HON04_09310 [Planctomicrobium sp.]|jgi:hypothetical protein|nr:hypothetical protein [Planctomicrobium sp.]